MKKVIATIFCLVLCAGAGAFAQGQMGGTGATMQKKGEMQGTSHMTGKKGTKDCLIMQKGRMVIMKGGKSMAMTKEMTMPNGSEVKPNGEVIEKDGKTMTLKNGMAMDMTGKLMPMKGEKKMGMKGRQGMSKKSEMQTKEMMKKKNG